jgi:hypothetical protein
MKSRYPSIAVALALTTVVWIYFYSKDQPLDRAQTFAVAAVSLAFLFLVRKAVSRWSKSPHRAIPRTKNHRIKNIRQKVSGVR